MQLSNASTAFDSGFHHAGMTDHRRLDGYKWAVVLTALRSPRPIFSPILQEAFPVAGRQEVATFG